MAGSELRPLLPGNVSKWTSKPAIAHAAYGAEEPSRAAAAPPKRRRRSEDDGGVVDPLDERFARTKRLLESVESIVALNEKIAEYTALTKKQDEKVRTISFTLFSA